MNIDNGFGAGCLAHRINVLGASRDKREMRDTRER
jgi:NCAIR mutase (PurE)-related protein